MDRTCTCAVCMGFTPWTERFAECMQVRFRKTWAAIADGTAVEVPR